MVKYDPDTLNDTLFQKSHVRLYQQRPDGDLQYVFTAYAKPQFHRAIQEVEDHEVSKIRQQLDADKNDQQMVVDTLEDIRNTNNRTAEDLFELHSLQNINKELTTDFEEQQALEQIGIAKLHEVPCTRNEAEKGNEPEAEKGAEVENIDEYIRRLTELESKIKKEEAQEN